MVPQDAFHAYKTLIENHPDVELKGKTMPYTSLNGHMFSHLDKTGNMGLRLSTEDRTRFLTQYETKIFEQHGRQMKEYVQVPEDLLLNTDKLLPYFAKSVEYIKTLKPKPTKKN